MADNGELREDLKIPDGELGTQLRADYEAGKELLVSKFLLTWVVIYIKIFVSIIVFNITAFSTTTYIFVLL